MYEKPLKLSDYAKNFYICLVVRVCNNLVRTYTSLGTGVQLRLLRVCSGAAANHLQRGGARSGFS
jgi:hypothetical protein